MAAEPRKPIAQSVTDNSFHLYKARIMSGSLELPDHFEVVVVGTGLVESIVAAAAARGGHSVLHVDTADHYGGDWASFNLTGLLQWAENQSSQKTQDKTPDPAIELQDGESYIPLKEAKTFDNVSVKWNNNTSSNQSEKQDVNPESARSSGVDTDVPQGDDASRVVNSDDTKDIGDNSDNTKESDDNRDNIGDESKKRDVFKELMELSRRFNLDLSPRLLYSRGAMVELLISSNISRYTEFKSVTRVLTSINGQLEHVPSSRADVFGTKHISVVEKRLLMKFLSSCLSEENSESNNATNSETNTANGDAKSASSQDQDKVGSSAAPPQKEQTFLQFLKQKKLTDNLIHFVVHAIAMVPKDASMEDGLRETLKFLSSLGRFGNTPFLWSMYGTGELPQAFCRLCAVFGGVYYLGRSVQGLVIKESRCVGIVTENRKITCDKLVLPHGYIPAHLKSDSPQVERLRRGIYLNSRSLMACEKEQLTFLSLPLSPPVHVIEVSAGTGACPKGVQVVYATSKYSGAEPEFDPLNELTSLLPTGDDHMFSLSFDQTTSSGEIKTKLDNLYQASGPRFELDLDLAVVESQQIYKSLYPEEEFLPRAPDPEEVIIGGDDEGEGEEDKQDQEKCENDETHSATEEKASKKDADQLESSSTQNDEETSSKTDQISTDTGVGDTT